jgi:hypothetical protein
MSVGLAIAIAALWSVMSVLAVALCVAARRGDGVGLIPTRGQLHHAEPHPWRLAHDARWHGGSSEGHAAPRGRTHPGRHR